MQEYTTPIPVPESVEPVTAVDAPPAGRRLGAVADAIGRRFPSHALAVDAVVCVAGFVLLSLLLIGIGTWLTGIALDGPLGRWDVGVVRDLAAARTPTLDRWTLIGSYLGDTLTVIAVATVATIALAIRRAWALIGLLVGALFVEVTAFLLTTFLIDRPRPPVVKLDAAPPTSSFPSGHTAAAVVLYVSLAVIVSSLTTNRLVRAIAWIAAIALPAAVGVSRLARGMHHPTDIAGSLVGAFACLVVSLLAVRSALASADASARESAP